MTESNRSLPDFLAFSAVVLFVVFGGMLCGSCEISERAKQIETYRTLSGICDLIEKHIESHGTIRESEMSQHIVKIAGGRDAWNYEIRGHLKPGQEAPSYVVFSVGSDGRPDFADPDVYFSLKLEDIRGLASRDIVFRNGECVTNAGKDRHSDYPRR